MAASGYYYWIYRLDHDRFVPVRCKENFICKLQSGKCRAEQLETYKNGYFQLETYGEYQKKGDGCIRRHRNESWHKSQIPRHELLFKRKSRPFDRILAGHPFVLGPFAGQEEPFLLVRRFHEDLISNFGYLSSDMRLSNISHMEDVLEELQFNTSPGRKILRYLLSRNTRSSCTVLFQVPVEGQMADDFFQFDCGKNGKISGVDERLIRYLAELVLTVLYNFGGVLTVRDILPLGSSRLLSTGQSLTIPRYKIKSLRFCQTGITGLNARDLRESYSYNVFTGKSLRIPKNYIFTDSSEFALDISSKISPAPF